VRASIAPIRTFSGQQAVGGGVHELAIFAVSRDVEEHVLKAKFINAQNACQYMDQVFTGALPRAGFCT
jgi:hypothetical protein